MQSVSTRIWTRVAMYISYDHNHYTMGTSTIFIIIIINIIIINHAKLFLNCLNDTW